MKKPTSFLLILLFSFCFIKAFPSEKYDSTQLGYIQIKSPNEGHIFSLYANNYNFKWEAPDNISDGQQYCYELSIAEIHENENPDSIINDNSFYNKITDTVDYITDWSISINDNQFNSSTHYAWQVKAFSGDSVTAKSEVYTFYGPPYLEEFKAGNHPVNVIRTTTNSLDSLCGIGDVMFKRNGERHKVKFNGIRVERTGAELYLREGLVVAKCKTPEIKLKPEVSINGNAFFMTDSILLDQEDFKISGYVRWEISDSTLNEGMVTVKSNKAALKYNDLKLLGSAYITNKQKIKLTHPFKSELYLDSNSRFFISGNKYNLHLTGAFKGPIQSRTSKQDTLSLPFKDQEKLSFFYKNTIQTDQQIKLAPGTSIMMNINDYVIDLSDNKSPKYHEDSLKWKGLSFENFKISARKDSTFSFKINEFPGFIDTTYSKKCHASLSDNDTIIDIQTTTDTLEGTYNSFAALYDKIQIEYLNDSLQWLVKGNINIPYLPDDKRIIIKSKNNRIQLAKSIFNSSFKVFPMYIYEFNKISASYADTIVNAQIDQQEKNIELSLLADFVKDNIEMDFDFKGRKIQLNNNNLVKGDAIYLDTYQNDYNYSLSTYSLKDESTNYDFKIYRPLEIYLEAKDQNTLSNGGGKVKGEGSYKYNSKATIKAIPKDDYIFKFWEDRNTGDVFSEEDSISFKIKKNLSLIAYFSDKDTETRIRNQNIQGIKIYPNPTNGNVYLNSKDYKIDQLKILDITGKKVIIRRNLDKTTKIDISHLDNGIYLIQIKTDEGSTIRKIIKE